jgi:hypothetical protein
MAWDIEAKLILQGMDPADHSLADPDDEAVIERATSIAELMALEVVSTIGDGVVDEAVNEDIAALRAMSAVDAARSICVLHARDGDLDVLLADLARQRDEDAFEVSAVLCFASSQLDPRGVSAGMQELFPAAQVFGCTTSGEQTSSGFHQGSIVMMLFAADAVPELSVAVVEGLSEGGGVRSAAETFQRHFGVPMMQMSRDEYVGLILIDGLSGAEERVMTELGNGTNVRFVGASAGDDMRFEATHVFANGRHYTDSALLVLMKPAVDFEIVKTQSVEVLEPILRATKVSVETREVIEFNDRPASEVYAEALGCTLEDAAARTFLHPLGLMVAEEPFLRSPLGFVGTAMQFQCQILEGMHLRLCEAKKTVETTRDVVEEIQRAGPVSGLLNFHCAGRTLELTHRGRLGEYEKIFADVPTAGFCSYGEQYIGHMNQTSTMLVFR